MCGIKFTKIRKNVTAAQKAIKRLHVLNEFFEAIVPPNDFVHIENYILFFRRTVGALII